MDAGQRDEQLVRAALGGDKDAFGALLVRHRPLLMAMCRRALRDEGWAEDAAQEAALQALLNLDRLRRPERFGSWLTGIGLNICRRWRQSRVRDSWSWDAMIGGGLVTEPVDTAPGPEDVAEAAELRESVLRVVAELPPGQRAAVALHYLDGLTQAETAVSLGIGTGTVKMRLHRARARLRRTFGDGTENGTKDRGGQTMVEMRLVDVRRRVAEDGVSRRHSVILEEAGGERRLTIRIGESEAIAMALQLERTDHPRPLTYAFAVSLLQAASGRLHEIRIDRLEGDVFYASAIVEGPAGEQTADARPSDALNLALLLSTPIRVAEDVLAAAGGVRPGEEWVDVPDESVGAAAIAADVKEGWATAMGQHGEELLEETA